MKIKQILSTILVVLWMITIFNFSQQQGTNSSKTSKKISMIIIEICNIKNDIPQQEKENLVIVLEPIVRKLAHYFIYMIGGILIINCLYKFGVMRYVSIYSSIIGILYSITDETHQLFVNGRSGSIYDVLIDTIGILTGIVVFFLIQKMINMVVNKQQGKEGE